MAVLSPGVSGPEVKTLQQRINAAYNKSLVEESGSFDDKTAAAVSQFQREAKLGVSGSVDDKTMALLLWAAKDKREITYNGKTFFVAEGDEFKAVSTRLIAQSVAQTRHYVNMARDLKNMWEEQKRLREGNSIIAFFSETAALAKFPDASLINAAVDAANKIAAAAKGTDFTAYRSAVDGGLPKISQACDAMNDFLSDLYKGGGRMVVGLTWLRDGCSVTLEISAAVATGGSSVGVTAAVMGGVGSYKQLIGEIDKASVRPDFNIKAAAGDVLAAGVIGACSRGYRQGKRR